MQLVNLILKVLGYIVLVVVLLAFTLFAVKYNEQKTAECEQSGRTAWHLKSGVTCWPPSWL